MKTLILTLVALFSLTATVPAQKSEKITVRAGQQKSAPVSRIGVKFVSVTEDSRCPEGVNCIWAGVATIKILVSKNGKTPKEYELNTNQKDKSIIFGRHQIKLTALSPYPRSGAGPIKPDTYSAELSITKLPK